MGSDWEGVWVMEPLVIGTLIFLVCVVITGYGNDNLGSVSHIMNITQFGVQGNG